MATEWVVSVTQYQNPYYTVPAEIVERGTAVVVDYLRRVTGRPDLTWVDVQIVYERTLHDAGAWSGD